MIYFDNSATSNPKPESVINAVTDTLRNYNANPGRSGHKKAKKIAGTIIETRQNIGKLFNIDDFFQIVLTKNGTEALNYAILGILNENDHVITTYLEHNSVLRPLNKLEKENNVEIDYVIPDKEGFIIPSTIEKVIKKQTKLIIVNHVSNVIGTIQNIKEIGIIAKKHNINFMVDASQSAGVVNIDVDDMNIDVLASAGHKGLLGPQGTGFLYVNKKVKINNILSGGTGSNSFSVSQPTEMPDMLEAGTLNTPGIAGLNEGIKYILETGIENIRKEEDKLTKHMLEKLLKIDGVKIYGSMNIEERMPVISFNYMGYDPSEVSYILDKEFDIATRPGIHCAPLAHKYLKTIDKGGTIRVSLNQFNTIDEIDKFEKALSKIKNYL